MPHERCDCVVLGGGPAGSTFASIVKKYAPGASVVVLEKARFPRWHIGESTIPVANGVFKDLEVYDAMLESTFVKKMGVTFVWGRDRIPWSADYLTLGKHTANRGQNDVLEVTGQDFSALLGPGNTRDTPYSAFNVRRAEFDKMLLDRTKAFGADVREGTMAREVLRDAEGRVTAVRWEDDRGRSGIIETPFVLDATGLSHMMTRGQREYDDTLNNFAVHGYLSGAEWKVNFSGRRDHSTVFIAAVEKGWIWYFPIGQDLMTVGAVTNTRHFKDCLKGIDLESFFWEMLRACPEVADLVKDARLRDDILPCGARVSACQDWSSWAKQPVGAGWASAGDAAMFVDPILSTGVTLALQTGHRAAYTFLTARARPELSSRSLWHAYGNYMRGEYGAYLKLARFFYGNNKAAPSWWWEAQQLVNASGKLELNDRQAFTMATAGFFPIPRAFGNDAHIVYPMIQHLSGTTGNVYRIYHDAGVPEPDDLERRSFDVLTRFRLDLRTEPGLERDRMGQLDVYLDLVPEELGFYHRMSAVPCRIAPAMAPVVDAMARHRRVADLCAEAPALVASGVSAPEAVRRATLEIVRVAAMKGFVRIHPEPEKVEPCPST
jgi:flavin-dependent dehydrogenase